MQRLDVRVQHELVDYSRQQIQAWILGGNVLVNDKVVTKPGMRVADDAIITYKNITPPRYVSRAGFKLEHALQQFNVDPTGLVVLDAGLSTGGFTDCLLQHGAQKVFGVDVGTAQVRAKIKNDPRVVVLEQTHLNDVTPALLGQKVDLVTLDLSFISVLRVIDAVIACMKPNARLIILIKPQFEVPQHDIGRGGIVKNDAVHQRVIQDVTSGIEQRGFKTVSVIDSPITGGSGNKEFLAYFERTHVSAD